MEEEPRDKERRAYEFRLSGNKHNSREEEERKAAGATREKERERLKKHRKPNVPEKINREITFTLKRGVKKGRSGR